jgi:hypothetical protein
VPVEGTNATRNDGSNICGRLLTAVADHSLSFIALLEKVRQLFVAILPLGRFDGGDFFILAIGTSLDAFKAGLQFLREAECARNALLQIDEGSGKHTLVRGHARWVSLVQALIAKPLVGKMVRGYHAHTFKVE